VQGVKAVRQTETLKNANSGRENLANVGAAGGRAGRPVRRHVAFGLSIVAGGFTLMGALPDPGLRSADPWRSSMNGQFAPPPPPNAVALDDAGGSDRLRLRLQQISLTTVTILITTWCVTLGTIPAVVSITVAKHVLVAILVMGLGIDREIERPTTD
jgi:hypothetical protein